MSESIEEQKKQIRAAVLKERERCAKIATDFAQAAERHLNSESGHSQNWTAMKIAEHITKGTNET